MTELLTIDEVAATLKVSKRTVQRAIEHRGLRAVQVAGRGTWRVRPDDLDAWLEQRASTGDARPSRVGAGVASLALATARPRAARGGRLAVTADMGRA